MDNIQYDIEHYTSNITEVKYLIKENRYEDAKNVILKLLEVPYTDDSYVYELLKLQSQCNINDQVYSSYNPSLCSIVGKYIKQNQSNKITPNSITVTMTTCKRYDLFTQTVNSFLACCLDLDEYLYDWIVIDDNSSYHDRKLMKEKYPFISYIFKTPEQKGHAQSMNMLIDKIVTPYVFHLEDDWRFFTPDRFITKCIYVLLENSKYGQCLLNRGYSEDIEVGTFIGGGHRRYTTRYDTMHNLRYYIHEYAVNNALNKINQTLSTYNFMSSTYWPHYSLRVGLMRRVVFDSIGKYNETADHFEREYAYRYREQYLTTYLDNIVCTHIGRKTYERDSNKDNAYTLNNEHQFGIQSKPTPPLPTESFSEIKLDSISAKTNNLISRSEEEQQVVVNNILPNEQISTTSPITFALKMYVLNLARRHDRLEKFRKTNSLETINYNIFDAIDGKDLHPCHKIQKLFEHNDYRYRRGIVGCALSHLLMWIELIRSTTLQGMIIAEDDARLTDNFMVKFLHLLSTTQDADIIFLNHYPYPAYHKAEDLDRTRLPTAIQWSKEKSIRESMGGTAAYYISRKGAENMIERIKDQGFRRGVDWEMFFNEKNKVYYCSPFLAFAECVQSGNMDTDIQNDYDGVGYNDSQEWFREEMKYWGLGPNMIVRREKCSKIELLSSICVFLLDEPFPITKNWLNMFPVHWYTVDKYFISVPDNIITDEQLKARLFDGHLNVAYAMDT